MTPQVRNRTLVKTGSELDKGLAARRLQDSYRFLFMPDVGISPDKLPILDSQRSTKTAQLIFLESHP